MEGRPGGVSRISFLIVVVVVSFNFRLSQRDFETMATNDILKKTGIQDWSSLATKPIDISNINLDELVDDTGSRASSVSDFSASELSLGLTSTLSSTKSRQASVAEAHTTYYPHPTTFKLSEKPIDEYKQLKVRVDIS